MGPIPRLGLSTDQVMAGADVVWVLSALVAGLIFTVGYLSSAWASAAFDDTTRVMVGIALACIGSAGHGAYGALIQWFRALGDHQTAAAFADALAGIGGGSIVIMCIGFALKSSPAARRLFGRTLAALRRRFSSVPVSFSVP